MIEKGGDGTKKYKVEVASARKGVYTREEFHCLVRYHSQWEFR